MAKAADCKSAIVGPTPTGASFSFSAHFRQVLSLQALAYCLLQLRLQKSYAVERIRRASQGGPHLFCIRAARYLGRKTWQVMSRLPGATYVARLRRRVQAKCLLAKVVGKTLADTILHRPIVVPQYPCPLVSIVIPVHNEWKHTLWCLQSIIASSGEVPYEVIVADDASTDATVNIRARIENVRLAHNDATTGGPLGFLKNCNAAAAQARGKYLLLLNNDTLVKKGWLQALVDVAEGDDRVGLVGCKLIFPNGLLQEAGGIIWRDGSGCNCGRNQGPCRPEYNYLRDVDYISGAAILVRRSLWNEIGGFDERFTPAYYEDADLAFEIRKRGRRVVYQPAAEVIHFEGVSHGTDLKRGIKRRQLVNRERFVEKWKTVLDGEHYAPGSDLFLARHRNRPSKRVLVLDWALPTPDQDAGSLRIANLLKILAGQNCQVTLYPIVATPFQPYLRQFQQQGVFVLCGASRPPLDVLLKKHGPCFDLVIVSRMNVGKTCMDMIRRHCSQAVIVFDTVDLHFLREHRRGEVENDAAVRAAAQAIKKTELRLMRQADLTLVVSHFEADLLRREAADVKVRILSTIHAIHRCGHTFGNRKGLLFIGNFIHSPNVDAIRWFLQGVFPELRRRLDGVRLNVIGKHLPKELRKLARDDVLFLGHVRDIEPYLQRCRLSVAPLRYGAGVKGKINMSMSYGLPVVSTRIGCEGMFLQDGVDVLVADDAQAMADAVCRLYQDESLWTRLSQAGIDNIDRHFSFAVAEETVRDILAMEKGVVAKPHAREHSSLAGRS